MPLAAARQATPDRYRETTCWIGCQHPAPFAATYLPLGGPGCVAVVLNTLVVTRETAPLVAAWAAALRDDGRQLLAILEAEVLAGERQQKAG